MDTRVNIYFRKWFLLFVLNLTPWKIKENKEIKLKKNIKKISNQFLALFKKIEGQNDKLQKLVRKSKNQSTLKDLPLPYFHHLFIIYWISLPPREANTIQLPP